MKSALNLLREEDMKIFLAEHWQKKPLLIRQAVSDIISPLTPDELAGLACEADTNARLILEHPGCSENETPWSVEYGPFDEGRFSNLPESHWSLLVSDVEKHIEAAADMIEQFRFIPDWRIDDLMISYAPPGGSVGPHTDAYDVFLLQLQGQRQWSINGDFDQMPLENTELSILKNFTPAQQWTLNPGDMLYLPPNVAHHGVALNNCMTASIGFRAPAVNAIVSGYADRLAGMIDDSVFYTDPDLSIQPHPAEISADAIIKTQQLLTEQLTVNTESVQRWLGEYSSDPKSSGPEPPAQKFTEFSALRDVIMNHTLRPAVESNFLFSKTQQGALLFVDGKSYAVTEAFAEHICQRNIHCEKLFSIIDSTTEQILLDLYHQGALIIHD